MAIGSRVPAPLPLPDLQVAFTDRLRRLVQVLAAALVDDRERLLVLPAGEVLSSARRVRADRAERSALSALWQATSLPAVTAFRHPLPWSYGTALDLAAADVEVLAAMLAAEVQLCAAAMVDPKLLHAVLSRPDLVQRWPRPSRAQGLGAFALDALVAGVQVLPADEHAPSGAPVGLDLDGTPMTLLYWPGDAAPAVVAAWARPGFARMHVSAEEFDVAATQRVPQDIVIDTEGREQRLPAAGLAVLHLIERDIRESSRRPVMAIDAGKVHHEMVGGMRDWPKDGRRHRGLPLQARTIHDGDLIERVELLERGSAVQLNLPMHELEGMQDHAIEALRTLRGAKGLRHWAALLRLFSVEGGRSGTYRWMLDEHLTAMGYDERRRRDPELRHHAAREVEALAALELALYSAGGVLRERRRLLLETGRFERLVGSEYKLEGIEFQMNQRVYSGVRESTGEIGRRWMPAPVELAQLDHVRQPYAHGLGMLLAVRIRWRIDEEADFLDFTGAKLLRLAGIAYKGNRAERAWDKLHRTLDALQSIRQIESYTWTDPAEAWSLSGICRIVYGRWLTDRAGRGVVPVEIPVDHDKPVTGKELKTWRTKHGWSQGDAAKKLKVSQQAVAKAEAKPDESLGHKIRAALTPFLDG